MARIKSSGVLLLLYTAATVAVVVAELQRFEHPVKSDGSLSFLVVGDWGRRGLYNQSNVAYQMGNVGEKMDVDFIVSTGDNFYDSGLIDQDDPAFFESFTAVYTAPSLQKQWYSVLGNHDYRGNVLAQLSPVLRQRDSKWLCLRSFILHAGHVDFFFVDTTPFQDKYFTEIDQEYDWRGVLPRQNYLSNLLKDVDAALKESSAKWKIVVGHHTIFSAGHHGNTEELVDKLLPILEANEVNMYINGHDHCLEHITSPNSGLQFLTSGGGSKAWRGATNPWNLDEMKFYYDGQGFMAAEITENEAYVAFYDIFGNMLHSHGYSEWFVKWFLFLGNIVDVLPKPVKEGFIKFQELYPQSIPTHEYLLQFTILFKIPWILTWNFNIKDVEGLNPAKLERIVRVKWWEKIPSDQVQKMTIQGVVNYFSGTNHSEEISTISPIKPSGLPTTSEEEELRLLMSAPSK